MDKSKADLFKALKRIHARQLALNAELAKAVAAYRLAKASR